jgi:hypothetical protein
MNKSFIYTFKIIIGFDGIKLNLEFGLDPTFESMLRNVVTDIFA